MSSQRKMPRSVVSEIATCVLLATMIGTTSAEELHQGLLAYWPLDEGSGNVSTDLFGAVIDEVELLNSPDWLDSNEAKFGGSGLRFDGLEQYVSVPDSVDLDIDTNAVSLSAWVNMDFLPSQLEESFGGIFDSNDDNYVLYLDKSAQELRFKVTDSEGVAERPGISESLLQPGEWNHVLGVYDGDLGVAKIYLNGEFIDSHANPNLTSLVRPGQVASIGANTTVDPENPASRFFAGAIDDVAVWNRSLGLAEAAYIYNIGVGTAIGAMNPDLDFLPDFDNAIVPSKPTSEPVIHLAFEGDLTNSGTGGADFDAVHLDEPDLNDELFTIGMTGQALDLRENPISQSIVGDGVAVDYVLPDDGSIVFDYTVGEYFNFQSLWTNSVDSNDWEMWIYNDGRVRGRVDGDSFAQFDLDNLSGLDETYQIAFTWDREDDNVVVTLYVDGEQREQDLLGRWVEPGDTVFIGGGDGANHFGNGIWDEFRVYDSTLTAGEVLYLYSPTDTCNPNSGGDLDGNGTVGFADFLLLSENFGTDVTSHADGDIDCNGRVEFADFLVLSRAFGTEVAQASAQVPEPSGTLMLLTAMGLLLLLRSSQPERV